MRRKNLKGVLAACLSFSMVVSGFSASAINVKKAQAAKKELNEVLTPDQITLREKWNDQSNIGEEHKVTIKGTGTEMTVKDNGSMRTELSSQYLAQNEMGAGINLGNTMEAIMPLEETEVVKNTKYKATAKECEQIWGAPETTQEYINEVHSYGINTLRIPVAWSNADMDDGTYTIKEEYLGRVEEIVNYALNNGMYVIINDHWDNQWWGQFGAIKYKEIVDEDGDTVKEPVVDENDEYVPDTEVRAKAWARYESYWKQIAERFKGYSDHLIFEGANEELGTRLADPIGKSGYAVGNDSTEQAMDGYMTEDEKYETANKINQTFVDIIRKSGGNNASRHLLIPGYDTDIDKTVDAEHTVTVTDKDGTAIKDEKGNDVKKKVGNRFVMPTDLEANGKTKLFLSVHYYTPWDFCGDGGTGKYTTTDQKKTTKYFESLKKFSDDGYAIIVGECGICNPGGVMSSVTQWMHDTFTEAQKVSAVPVLWDTGAYFDRKKPAMIYKDIADFYNTINDAHGDASMTKMTGGDPNASTETTVGKYIDQDLWGKTGIHAYLFFQTSTWDYRNNFKPFSLAGSDRTYEYIQASGSEAPDDTKVTDVMLTQDGTYTVSIEGAKITGTKYQMLGLATDLLVEKYPGVKISNATITVDGKNVMESPANPNPDPLNLIRKSDDAYYTFVGINTYDSKNKADETETEKYVMDGRNNRGKIKTPKKSISMTFTVSGLDAALKDIQNKTYVNPQTGKTIQQEEAEEAARKAEEERKAAEEAARKAAEEAARKAAEEAAKIPSPSGIATPPAAAKKVGLKVNKTFTVGNYKYKVTRRATTASQGAVSVVGLTKKGVKAKKLSVPASVKNKKIKYQVTGIGAKTFKGAKAASITLNKNIKTIPSKAFVNCKKLKTLTVNAKLKKVAKGAFKGCKKKIKVKGASAKVRKANVKLLKKSGYKKFK